MNTAFELYKEMEGMGMEADWVTYTTLMDLCAEARQGMRAVELLQVCFLCFCVACGSLLFGCLKPRRMSRSRIVSRVLRTAPYYCMSVVAQ